MASQTLASKLAPNVFLKMWYYEKNDQQHGPVSQEELKALVQSGSITKDDLAWREGMGDWQPICRVKEFAQPAAPDRTDYGAAPDLGLPKADYGPVPTVFPDAEKPIAAAQGMAVLSLVLGVISIVASCFPIAGVVCAVLALVCGYIYGSRGPGRGKAKAGRILGWLALVISAVIWAANWYVSKHPELLESLNQLQKQS